MPQYQITKVNIWSFGRTTGLIAGIVYGVGWLGFGIFIASMNLIDSYFSGGPDLTSFVLACPIGILVAAILGLGIGALVGLLFNLIAPLIGGLGIDIEIKE